MGTVILTASSVITMDDRLSRASAVAVVDDRIVAVGSLEACREVAPDADVIAVDGVLAPGFIEPHGHPFVSGVATQAPARSIAPWDAPLWDDVVAIFRSVADETDPAVPMWFAGFDALLHGRPKPTAVELDEIFGDRVVVVTDNSGHGVYFTTALMRQYGWDVAPPTDPVASHFGRTADGQLDGQGYELPVVMAVVGPLMAQLGNPLVSAANYFALMARGGYTSTSDMTFDPQYAGGYDALAAAPSCPLRVTMWEISTTATFAQPAEFHAPASRLAKAGVKLWTDGSPWVGNIAISFPYLDTPITRTAGLDPATAGGAESMNYTRAELDAVVDVAAPAGWQLAFHANGDLALDLALDTYEAGLARHGLLGTDHRWRIEHAGAGSARHFERAARLGVHVSMAPFQYRYWGDVLDGGMFQSSIGSQWCAMGDAVASGASASMHNDGSVSPPEPLSNIATVVTRRTRSGAVHGASQAVSLEAAWRAQTIDAAFAIHREHEVGSIEVGKLADFVVLSADPWSVPHDRLLDEVAVVGTWVGGEPVDLEEFLAAVGGVDPTGHAHLAERKSTGGCC